MAVYMISYDLKNPGQNYEELYEKIKSLSHWAYALQSAWMVDVNMTAQSVFEYLRPCIDASDYLIVTEIKGAWWGILNSEVLDWLKQRVP